MSRGILCDTSKIFVVNLYDMTRTVTFSIDGLGIGRVGTCPSPFFLFGCPLQGCDVNDVYPLAAAAYICVKLHPRQEP